MNLSRKRRQTWILLVDLIIFYISLIATLWIRNGEFPSFNYINAHLTYFWIVALFWILSMYTLNMYSLEKPFDSIKTSYQLFSAAVIGTLIGFATFYLSPDSDITPKTVLVLFSAISYCGILLWRWVYGYIFHKISNHQKVIFTGYATILPELIPQMDQFSYMQFTPVGVYEENPELLKNIPGNIPVISDVKDLEKIINEYDVKVFVLPEGKAFPQDIRNQLFSALGNGAVFFTLPDFYEKVTRKIPLGAINENWFLRNINLEHHFFDHIIKRFFDLFFSIIVFAISLVFWPIIALIIKIESPGPVFFKQVREGRNGKLFTILKFRTMKTTDNNYAPTTEQDNRITRFGNIMRKTRLDEIPQFLNIIKGDMSFIGPRPERPELARELEKKVPFYRQRLLVKPGITGWDQVSGEYHSPSMDDTYKKLQYDLYYIKNQSVFLDISIFFKTITTVIMRGGR